MAAMSGSAKPTVFVYPFDSELTGEWMYQNLTAGDHDNHFRGELELLQRFKEHPQASPPPPAACCTHAHRPRLHLLRHHDHKCRNSHNHLAIDFRYLDLQLIFEVYLQQ